jgi:hypothetical protein
MGIGLLIIIVVAAVALIVKRFQGEPMNARDTFGTSLILVAIGTYSVTKVADLNGTDITWLVIGGTVGISFGALRGITIGISTATSPSRPRPLPTNRGPPNRTPGWTVRRPCATDSIGSIAPATIGSDRSRRLAVPTEFPRIVRTDDRDFVAVIAH